MLAELSNDAREWLEEQAAAGILTVEDASAAAADNVPPAGYVDPLLDPESLSSIAPFLKSVRRDLERDAQARVQVLPDRARLHALLPPRSVDGT